MSKTFSAPSGTAPRKARMQERDAALLCASVPKHTQAHSEAMRANASSYFRSSQATPSTMSYCGTPAPSRLTCTVLVGLSDSCREYASRFSSSARMVSCPSPSRPTALSAMPSRPSPDT